MGDTRTTAPGQLSPESFAGTMQPYPRVAGRNPGFRGKASNTDSIEVHPPKHSRVLLLQRTNQFHDAGADDPLQLRVGRIAGRLGFSGEAIQSSVTGASAPEVVRNGIPEHAIEPGGGRRGALGWGMTEGSDKRLLKDVLRLGA